MVFLVVQSSKSREISIAKANLFLVLFHLTGGVVSRLVVSRA